MSETKPNYKRKSHYPPVWAVVIIDLLVTGMILCGFALFHHVVPRSMEPLNIVVANPNTGTSNDTNVSGNDSAAPQETLAQESEVPEETAPPTWAEKFADHFTDTVIETETSYSSPKVSINIEKKTMDEGRDLVTYYVADIYVADIECFQTYLAKDTYGKGYREDVLDMDLEANALLAMTGDFYGYQDEGLVIRNGTVYRADSTDLDMCVLYYDGTMETFSPDEFDLDTAVAKGAYQGWTFGPMLLDKNGDIPTQYNAKSKLMDLNPRSGFGYFEPGHYCFVVVDGRDRGYSRGVTPQEFSQIFKDLGCVAAYNMDGGESAIMSFNDEVVNLPFQDGRGLSDCLIIKEVGA